MHNMLVSVIRLIFMTTGIVAGIQAGKYISNNLAAEELQFIPYTLTITILFGLGYVTGGVAGRKINSIANSVIKNVSKYSSHEILAGVFGLTIGLIIAALISIPVSNIQFFGNYIAILIFAILGYFGILISVNKISDMAFVNILDKKTNNKPGFNCKKKILDTSAIIDGRILDIAKAGFLEGHIIVPRFILNELHSLADSEDTLKRNRARRGIDILKELRQSNYLDIQIDETDYLSLAQVDGKLIKMATEKHTGIITNDYNLSKMAQVENIPVLNVNELSNAVKPILFPGEHSTARILKEGKEKNQGISYLNDGTMIVIEDSKDKIGQDVEFIVTSVIQTQAGRMIFGKLKDNGEINNWQ